jgi:hypothetical protein
MSEERNSAVIPRSGIDLRDGSRVIGPEIARVVRQNCSSGQDEGKAVRLANIGVTSLAVD